MLPENDLLFLVVWTLSVCALALVFGLLHLIAGISAMVKGYRPWQIVMLIGCLITLAAVPACILGWPGNLDAVLMAAGGGTVCGAAFYNGRRAMKEAGDKRLFHLSHHISRLAFVLVLVMNFIRV